MSRGRVLTVLAAADLLAMASWFSASAVAAALGRLWQLGAMWAMLVLRRQPEATALAGGRC